MDFDISWVDGCLLAVVMISMLVGALRGLVFEVLSLAGWVVSYFAAQLGTPMLAPHVPVGTPGSLLNHGVTFACLFIATLIVWSIVTRLIRSLVHATPLRPIDRLLGAGFGILRGALLLLVAAAIVGFTPAAKTPSWQASIGAKWLNAALKELRPMLPSEVAHFVPA